MTAASLSLPSLQDLKGISNTAYASHKTELSSIYESKLHPLLPERMEKMAKEGHISARIITINDWLGDGATASKLTPNQIEAWNYWVKNNLCFALNRQYKGHYIFFLKREEGYLSGTYTLHVRLWHWLNNVPLIGPWFGCV